MLQRAARNAYSWWWASHIRTKQSKWLEDNLQDMEEKVEYILKIIEEGGDSFAQRAEMYYRKRPELVNYVEDSFKGYRALAERYDHLSKELQNANRTIASVYPERVQLHMDDEDGGDNFPPSETSPELVNTFPEAPKMSMPKHPNLTRSNAKVPTRLMSKKGLLKFNTVDNTPNTPRSGLSKGEALKEIDSLQKGILVFQTEKEFCKSSYETGLAKYWEIENLVTEMQVKVSNLQDEFGIGTYIDDDEARKLMTGTALKSCRDKLTRLQEKQKDSTENARVEYERIQGVQDRFNVLKQEFIGKQANQIDMVEEQRPENENKNKNVESLRAKITEELRVSSGDSLTMSELAEKANELVDKVINLECEISSQNAYVIRLKSETNELQAHLQSLEEEKESLIENSDVKNRKIQELEEELRRVQNLKVSIKDNNDSLQTQFTEASCTIDNLSENLLHTKADEEIESSTTSFGEMVNPVKQFQESIEDVKAKFTKEKTNQEDKLTSISIEDQTKIMQTRMNEQGKGDELMIQNASPIGSLNEIKSFDDPLANGQFGVVVNESSAKGLTELGETMDHAHYSPQIKQDPFVQASPKRSGNDEHSLIVGHESIISECLEKDKAPSTSSFGYVEKNQNKHLNDRSGETDLGKRHEVYASEGSEENRRESKTSVSVSREGSEAHENTSIPRRTAIEETPSRDFLARENSSEKGVEEAHIVTSTSEQPNLQNQFDGVSATDLGNRSEPHEGLLAQPDISNFTKDVKKEEELMSYNSQQSDLHNHVQVKDVASTGSENQSNAHEGIHEIPSISGDIEREEEIRRYSKASGISGQSVSYNPFEDFFGEKDVARNHEGRTSEAHEGMLTLSSDGKTFNPFEDVSGNTQERDKIETSQEKGFGAQKSSENPGQSEWYSAFDDIAGPTTISKSTEIDENQGKFDESKKQDLFEKVYGDPYLKEAEFAVEDDDQPNWKELFLNGLDDREKLLLQEYTSTLRNFKDVKKKLNEVEKKKRASLFQYAIQIKVLRSANAVKDSKIESLQKKLGTPQDSQESLEKSDDHFLDSDENKIQESSEKPSVESTDMIKQSTAPEQARISFAEDDEGQIEIIAADELHNFSTIEDKIRMDIDELLEENIEFWLRFSTSFHQIQKFQNSAEDLQAELVKVKENKKNEGNSKTTSLLSEIRPIYRHLREIQTELTLWLEHNTVLKDDLQTRLSSLSTLHEELMSLPKANTELEKSELSDYQAAKFQGEILNMKQENNKVADELQAGVERVKNLQTEIQRTLSNLDEELGISSKNQQQTKNRSKIPLRSFLFGAKVKKHRHSLFACVTPTLQKQYSDINSVPT